MKKRARKSLTWLGVVLLVIAGVLIIATVAAKKSVDRARAKLEAEGRPMTLDSVLSEPIPDQQNAAIVYDAAVEQLEGETPGEESLFSTIAEAAAKAISDDATPETLEAFRALYQQGAVAEAIAAIREGSLRPGYRQDLDFSKGIALELPHIHDLMRLSRILAATARMQAADGDQAAAWETALTGLRLANALEDEPILVSQLVRIATLRTAVETIRQLDLTSAPLPTPAAETGELLRHFETPDPMVAAIDFERIQFGEIIQPSALSTMATLTGDGADVPPAAAFLYQVFPPLSHYDQAEHMKVMGEFARNMGEPYSPDTDPHIGSELVGDIPPYCLFSRMCTPAIGSIKPRMTESFADARVTRAGLAVIEHRNTTGSYPADLQSLGLEDTADPFTGESLVYRPNPSGFTLYSLGQDAVDNNGIPLDDKRNGDIIWRYSEN